jgi:hypothetical protein
MAFLHPALVVHEAKNNYLVYVRNLEAFILPNISFLSFSLPKWFSVYTAWSILFDTNNSNWCVSFGKCHLENQFKTEKIQDQPKANLKLVFHGR